MGVYLLGENFATQGPAPDGFHVPLNTEWQAVYNVWTALGGGSSDGTNFGIALKLPSAGFRATESSNAVYQGSYGVYWSASRYNESNAYRLFLSSAISLDNNSRAGGYSVRGFKNSPVVPTSSWTKLYGTSIEAGGIFWSSADGLISLSSDGTTWITIADKNLGATTVWNSGDTLSEANCGKYYQRGNNYGFAWTGSITTSSTQVNASAYGPGNYYSSSTFITRSSSPYDWSSVQNDNLWGGEDGNVPTMSELKNAYIGEYVETDYLCFTANTAGSTIALNKQGSPTVVTLETSTDGNNWSTYTIGNTITLSNVGDKVYWRNTSETTTRFSLDTSNYYQFSTSGSVSASGDINFLLNKNSTTTLSNGCYNFLFFNANYNTLTTTPKLPATTLGEMCYYGMFRNCYALETLPELPATTLTYYCYGYMFNGCTKIKLSTTQTGAYQTAYRIPTTGTGTSGSGSLASMFGGTGGTFTSDPSINTTYYTSNTVV